MKSIDNIINESVAGGAASIDNQPVELQSNSHDPIIQQYNSHWGLISNTVMRKKNDQYFITGSLVQRPDSVWNCFCCAHEWRGFNFSFYTGTAAAKTMSLCNWAETYGYLISREMDGGEIVAKLVPMTLDNVLRAEGVPVPRTYYTSESRIPRPLCEIETERGSIEDCFEGDVKKICENLNKSRKVLGNNWTYVDGLFISPYGNKYIILK